MRRIVLFLLVALLCFPVASGAEIREGSFELGPFLGVYGSSPDFSNKAMYGMRAGYNFTPHWGIEGAYSYVESRATLYQADALYHFSPEKALTPFVFAGIGGANNKPEGKDAQGRFLADIGAGIKYYFAKDVGLRADVRDVMTNYHNLAVTVGLTFAFGGKTPKAAPAAAPAPAPEAPKPAPKAEAPKPAPAPEPVAAKPAPAPEAPKAEPLKIILEDIHFDFDKATLTAAAKDILGKNVQTIKANPGMKVQIEGHACAHGPEKYNMALSERRANAVKEYLVKAGIDAGRLSSIAYGETRLAMPETPTAKNKESVEARTNRRVHFEVIVK